MDPLVKLIFGALITFNMSSSSAEHHFDVQTVLMEQIATDFLATSHITGRLEMSPKVYSAIHEVKRHKFVAPNAQAYAYQNTPLAIGHGQTISQPFIVALMTELLELRPGDRVLEIGTGSGYQAAVLGRLVEQVYTIEIIEPLASQARVLLAELAFGNVTVKTGDGNHGWPEKAPFDSIIITAAGRLAPALLKQLSVGGRMVAPVTHSDGRQELTLVERLSDTKYKHHSILPVRFVPLTGDN